MASMPTGQGRRHPHAFALHFVRCDQLTQTYALHAAQDSGHRTRTNPVDQALLLLVGNRKLLNPFFNNRTVHDFVP